MHKTCEHNFRNARIGHPSQVYARRVIWDAGFAGSNMRNASVMKKLRDRFAMPCLPYLHIQHLVWCPSPTRQHPLPIGVVPSMDSHVGTHLCGQFGAKHA